MSNIAYKGNPLGSGTITLETPNTNTDRTLTLPDSTGTLVHSDANGTLDILSTSTTASTFRALNNGTNWSQILCGHNGASTNYYDADTQIFRNGATQTERMRIDSSGRVTMPYQPSFRVQGLPAVVSSGNTFLWATESHDIGNNYNPTNGRFTAPVTGVYIFHASSMGDATDSRLMLRMRINGNQVVQGSSSSNASQYQDSKATIIIKLTANDYVDVYNAGNKSTYGTGTLENYFAGHLLG